VGRSKPRVPGRREKIRSGPTSGPARPAGTATRSRGTSRRRTPRPPTPPPPHPPPSAGPPTPHRVGGVPAAKVTARPRFEGRRHWAGGSGVDHTEGLYDGWPPAGGGGKTAVRGRTNRAITCPSPPAVVGRFGVSHRRISRMLLMPCVSGIPFGISGKKSSLRDEGQLT